LQSEVITGIDRYRVEVSGLDEGEIFLVEKSQLAWDDFAGKHVSLRHLLPDDALVFVRVLQLLGVIQNREIRRVGSPEITAGQRSAHRRQSRPSRRSPCWKIPRRPFYRLSSIQIRIPSLSERLEDIPLLLQLFLKKYNDAYGKSMAGLTRRAQTVLLQHPWPGNVREL
jgi:hypothetical protein